MPSGYTWGVEVLRGGTAAAAAEQAHLNEGVFTKPRARQSGCGPKEARVGDLFHRLPDGEDQCGVGERHHNVGIKVVCMAGGGNIKHRTDPQNKLLD